MMGEGGDRNKQTFDNTPATSIIASQNTHSDLLGLTSSNVAQATLLLLVLGSLRLSVSRSSSSSLGGNLLGLDNMFVVHPGIPLLLDLVLGSLVCCLSHLVVPLDSIILDRGPQGKLELGLSFGKEIARHSVVGEVKREDHHPASLYVINLVIAEDSALKGGYCHGLL